MAKKSTTITEVENNFNKTIISHTLVGAIAANEGAMRLFGYLSPQTQNAAVE